MSGGPIIVDLDDGAPGGRNPATEPPVPDPAVDAPEPEAVRAAAALAARRMSAPARLFWISLTAFAGFSLSVAAWRFAENLISANPALGWAGAGLLGSLVLSVLAMAAGEAAAFARLRRIDAVRRAAEYAVATGRLADARRAAEKLSRLYRRRGDLALARRRVGERAGETLDGDALLRICEREYLGPLDIRARREVEAAARQVATVTAVVPLALADVAAALFANMRMIRRVAEIYGGRSGALGTWRLTRSVFTHLIATGVMSAGDDMLGSLAGGGLLSRLSRRFGEGIVNGALTARVGLAAMESCRPLPRLELPAPRLSAVVGGALKGVFGSGRD